MSARSTISVFACGMSRPDSMIVVEHEHVVVAAQEREHDLLELRARAICPWPTPTRTSGTRRRSFSAVSSIVSTRLCRKKTCRRARARGGWRARRAPRPTPPRACGSAGGRRGGVAITEMSRRPASDMCSVRGIGVADSESTSTSSRSWRRSSFCATPKRCSSSTITSPSVFGHDVAREHAVGADQDVDLALGVVRRARS